MCIFHVRPSDFGSPGADSCLILIVLSVCRQMNALVPSSPCHWKYIKFMYLAPCLVAMEMHGERGTREERVWGAGGMRRMGDRVGDTGWDEAVDLICSPVPSSTSSASVCHLPPASCTLLLNPPRFIFLFSTSLLLKTS